MPLLSRAYWGSTSYRALGIRCSTERSRLKAQRRENCSAGSADELAINNVDTCEAGVAPPDGSISRCGLFTTFAAYRRIETPSMNHLKGLIREVPDFPKPGILFYDITTLLKDAKGLKSVIDGLGAKYNGQRIDTVVGIEARGFIFAPAVAYALGRGVRPGTQAGEATGGGGASRISTGIRD